MPKVNMLFMAILVRWGGGGGGGGGGWRLPLDVSTLAKLLPRAKGPT